MMMIFVVSLYIKLQFVHVTSQINQALDDFETSTDFTNWPHSICKSHWINTVRANPQTFDRIDLDDCDINGNLSSSIGNLINLKKLYLGGNDFTGNIPSSIGELINLEVLDLGYNDLTGNIPWSSIYNLINLERLDLDSNEFEGIIPSSIDNLVNLKNLDLEDNKLTGNIPSSIGNLINLSKLELNGNKLTQNIPSTIVELINLRELDLSENDLTGNIPSAIGNLAKLEELHLNRNQLKGNIPSSIGNLIKLEELRLEINQLTGPIPTSIFNLQNMEDIKICKMNNVCIKQTDIPARDAMINRARYSDLAQCDICVPTSAPTTIPTTNPTSAPTMIPTVVPTKAPTDSPLAHPGLAALKQGILNHFNTKWANSSAHCSISMAPNNQDVTVVVSAKLDPADVATAKQDLKDKMNDICVKAGNPQHLCDYITSVTVVTKRRRRNLLGLETFEFVGSIKYSLLSDNSTKDRKESDDYILWIIVCCVFVLSAVLCVQLNKRYRIYFKR